MTYLFVLLAIFATWRLTYDFLNLDGPFGLYRPLKALLESKRGSWPEWILDGFTCYHCCSWWAGFAVALLLPWSTWQEYMLFSIGISGAVTLIARYLKAMYGADLFE